MPITTEERAPSPLWLRLLWFVGLWAAGVLAVGGVAGVLRWLLHP